MKKKFLFLFLLLSGTTFSSYSQMAGNLKGSRAPEVFNGFNVKIPGSMYYPATGINGSPFFFDEFLQGTIYFTNGMISDSVSLNYNGLTDQLIILSEIASQYVKVDKNLITSFETVRRGSSGETEKYVFKRLETKAGDANKDFFAQVLFDGVVSAYVARNVIYTGKIEEKVVQNKLKAVRAIKKKPRFYLVLPDQTTITLNTISRRSLLKALPDKHSGQIKDLLVKNRVKVRREKGFYEAAMLINDYFKLKD